MNEKEYAEYFQSPEFQALLKRYETMKASGIGDYFEPDELTDVAEYYATNDRMPEAEEAIECALTIHPGSTDPLIFKARTHMLNGNLEEAYRIADSITDREDREVTFLYAELLINENRVSEAKELLVSKLYEEGETPEEHLMTSQDFIDLFDDYELYAESLQIAEADMQLAEAQEWGKKDMHTLLGMLYECYYCENRKQDAILILNRLLDDDPYNLSWWLAVGDLYNQTEQYDKAIDAFDYMLAIDPECGDAIYWQGRSYLMLDNHEKALECFRRSIELKYVLPLSNYSCGLEEVYLNLFDEAIPHLMAAYKHYGDNHPNSFEIVYNLTLCYTLVNDLKNARIFYKKGIRLSPNSQGLQKLKPRIMPDSPNGSFYFPLN